MTIDWMFTPDALCTGGSSLRSEEYLEKIGVEPSAKRNLILADGRQDARLSGFCDFSIEGLDGSFPCPVIFAPKGSLLLLGATAFETFGVAADPIQRTLRPIPAVIGGFLGSHPSGDSQEPVRA